MPIHPAPSNAGNRPSTRGGRSTGIVAVTSVLWLLMMSASLIESYAYRYAGILLVLLALLQYRAADHRGSISPASWLCIAWGVYAIFRYVWQFVFLPDHPLGDHDLLFVMPLFFPPLAFILLRCWEQMARLLTIHFALTLAVLLATIHFAAIYAGETVRPLVPHNQIHGAVCCGILIIGAIFWMIYYRMEAGVDWRMIAYTSTVCPAIVFLALVGIYGAKSKGVWLAFGLISPFVAVAILRLLRFRFGSLLLVAFAVLLAFGLFCVRGNLYQTAGPTFVATVSMLKSAGAHRDVANAVAQAIQDHGTPIPMDERLELWSDAWELFTAAPLFGWGSEWLTLWPGTHYRVDYTIMHNGYLEILVRYGLFGATVFSVMLLSFGVSVYRAAQRSIVPRSAFYAYCLILLFFGFTILSNSNNRLAMGESLALLSSAFALVCEAKVKALSLTERSSKALEGSRTDVGDDGATPQLSGRPSIRRERLFGTGDGRG